MRQAVTVDKYISKLLFQQMYYFFKFIIYY